MAILQRPSPELIARRIEWFNQHGIDGSRVIEGSYGLDRDNGAVYAEVVMPAGDGHWARHRHIERWNGTEWPS